MDEQMILKRYGDRVGYSNTQLETLKKGGHRIRHINCLFEAAKLYSIEATVIDARHCNSGHAVGQKIILDIDGNFISKLCPKKMCVYLSSQLAIPVALINERLSEGLHPSDFHFMRQIRCPDMGIDCLGYGEVTLEIKVIPRNKS